MSSRRDSVPWPSFAGSRATAIARGDGTRLFTSASGEGPTVVIAHGYLDSHESFTAIANRLVEAGRRVILFDQRGHGASTIGSDGLTPEAMAGDYVAVLAHYDVNDAVLVGHSMGGFLTVVFSILHRDVAAERLRGLVLIGAHAGDVARESLQNRLQIAMIQSGVMGLVTRSRRASALVARSLFGDVVEPAWIARAIEMVGAADIKRTVPILRAQVAESYYDRLDQVPVGAVVICGEKDKTCPRFHSERLGARIPRSVNVWLPRIGHMVPFEHPEAILDAVEDRLAAPPRG